MAIVIILVMFISMITIDISTGQGCIIIDVLESIKGQTASSIGCLGCLLTLEVGESKVCYQEKWANHETLERHLQSSLYTRILAAMELSCTPPTIEFFEVTRTGGLELVEIARNAH